ncbi:hypothetical protein Ddc_00349 [Ditylenchus destructor]|nr:hypothetical protein Ddc_00349 [Ditylenchus destructor]
MQILSARPVPIDSTHREEAIRISHAQIRAATGKILLEADGYSADEKYSAVYVVLLYFVLAFKVVLRQHISFELSQKTNGCSFVFDIDAWMSVLKYCIQLQPIILYKSHITV